MSPAGRETIPSTSQYSSTPNWPFSGPKLCQKRDSYLNLYVWCQFICHALYVYFLNCCTVLCLQNSIAKIGRLENYTREKTPTWPTCRIPVLNLPRLAELGIILEIKLLSGQLAEFQF